MLIRWKNKDKDKEKCEKSSSSSNQKQSSSSSTSKKKRKFGRDGEEEWNSDGKSGRASDGARSDNEGGEVRGRSRSARRDDPRRHTLGAGADGQYFVNMSGQGGPLSRTMDLEGHLRGYPGNAMLFDDDPGIMSEVETSSTGFRRGGKQRSSLPVVRTPSKTLERPLGLVFLQYRNETKRALLPNEITSIDTVKALFVRSFPKQLTMEYLDSPNVKIYIHDSSKDMFYELEDHRSHLREIRDRSVLRLFESADVTGGLPMAGIGIAGGVGHFEDPSYFSEPEFDSEYQHQHIHKSKMQETTTDIQENSEGTQSQAETQSSVINEVTDVPKNSDNVQKSKKRKQTNPDEIMTSAFNILKATSERNQSVTTNSRPPDECETYGAFIGNKLRLYTPRTRSYVQHHFSEIMFNADLGQYEYENTPGQNNEHPTNRYPCSDSYSGYGYSTTPSPATSNTHYSTTDNSQQVRDNYLQAIDKQPIVNSPHAMDNSQQVTGYSQQAAASSDSCHSKISDELTDDFNDLLH